MTARDSDDERSWTEIIAGLVLLIPSLLWKGFVFQKLWIWYLLPLGAPALGLWQGLGVWLIVKYATVHYDGRVDRRPRERWITATAIEWAVPAIFLLSGWLYNKFI